jgi:diguanylate cyclase (GGDEF)-like protein/PAS domain S-box-containing protein
MLLVILLPAIGVGFVAGRILTDRLVEQAESTESSLARSVAGEVARFLDAPLQLLSGLNFSGLPIPSAKAFVGMFPSVDRILFLNGAGRVLLVVPPRPALLGLDFHRQPFFLPPRRSGENVSPFWTSPFQDADKGTYFVALSVPWSRESGRIVAFMPLEPMDALAKRGEEDGVSAPELLILDASGVVIARSRPREGYAREAMANLPPIRSILEGRGGIFSYDDGGESFSAAAAAVPGCGWIVLVRRPLAEIRGPIDAVARTMGLAVALTVALAVLMAGMILRRISVSLETLEHRVRAVVRREDLPRGNSPFVEFDSVLRAFDGMAETIRARESALEESESRYALVLSSADEGLWDWNLLTGTVYYSDRFFEILGRERAPGLLDMETWMSWTYPKDRDEMTVLLDQVLAGGIPRYDHACRMIRGDGETIWVRSRGVAVFGKEGPSRMAGSLADVTAERRAEDALRLAAGVFENAQEGILITDPEGTILSANPAMVRMCGYAPEEMIGQNPRILKSDLHGRDFYERMWKSLLSEGRWQGEIYNRHKDGGIYPEWVTMSAVRDGIGRILYLISIARDLTERKRYEEKIAYEASHDALTDLPNRRGFLVRLEEDLRRAALERRSLGLLFMDLDGFKGVNDTLGHDVGDQLLIQVARRLLGAMRASDVVARMGGDEFTVILEPLRGPEDLRTVARKILALFEVPFDLAGRPVRSTPSIGGALFPEDATDLQGLLKEADLAMYRTKERGRNGVTLASDP